MQSFTRHTGTVVAMNRANVDTDAIMPKQYLKSIGKVGYGDWLFDDWRYRQPGDVDIDCSQLPINADFELNDPRLAGASILLAQENFGCGSSREHAVWGLRDFGFKVLVVPSFADIFYNNCLNNGLLPVTLNSDQITQLFAYCEAQLAAEQLPTISVDLMTQRLLAGELEFAFDIDPMARERLLKGLDAIGVTLDKRDRIRTFEDSHKLSQPWLFETSEAGA